MVACIRRGESRDAREVSRILRASIRELCDADHGRDESTIEMWAANKTEANVRKWMAAPENLTWVEDLPDGKMSGVAMATAGGHILLLYVDPPFAKRGVGRRLLWRLGNDLRSRGVTELTADSTRTALEFYLRQGFVWKGCSETFGPLSSYAVTKVIKQDDQF